MEFKKVPRPLLIRIGGLVLFALLFAFSISSDEFVVFSVLYLGGVGLMVVQLIKYFEQSKIELVRLAEALEKDLPTELDEESDLYTIYMRFQKMKVKQNSKNDDLKDDFHFYSNIIQHAGIGLITVKNDGNIHLINAAAKRLLKVNQLDHFSELPLEYGAFVDGIANLRTGGRGLIKLEVGGEIVHLAVYVIQLTLRGEEFKLLSIQNIQSELEEKEMEAWQDLVRVLTHEIMNSITPITSLANLVMEDIANSESNDQGDVVIRKSEFEDVSLAIQTIQKRSHGLLRFVQDFRSLSKATKPKIAEVPVRELFKEVSTLLKSDFNKNKINLSISIEPSDLSLLIDKELIMQVIINLTKNAIQSFDENHTAREISLLAQTDDKRQTVISVKDNGTGIEPEALERIFIPFFTTKKLGSGIGLSLSRQIMRSHQATINVKSTIGIGTEFLLKF